VTDRPAPRRLKLLGVPDLSSRKSLERRFEMERELEEVRHICFEAARPLMELMRGLGVRVTPRAKDEGVSISCEVYGERYSMHLSIDLNRLELRSPAFVRSAVTRLLAQLLENLAHQVRREAGVDTKRRKTKRQVLPTNACAAGYTHRPSRPLLGLPCR